MTGEMLTIITILGVAKFLFGDGLASHNDGINGFIALVIGLAILCHFMS